MAMSTLVEPASSSQLLTDQSVAKHLLFGSVLGQNLFPYPAISERDRESLGLIIESIDKFLSGKADDFKRWDRAAQQPAEFIDELRELGLFGLVIPEAFGGLGLSNAAYARVLSQTSRYDSSVSLTIGAHSSIGMKGLLLFGTAEQKARYLPRLAAGDMIAAFCLTEPGAGSDAGGIRTTATRNGDGSWTLNGSKLWITNGGIADFFTVFARTDVTEGKVTAFLVEAAWPGVSRGPHEDKMGIRASSTTTVSFSDVRVPPGNVLGEPGKGFKVAMAILNNGRTGLGGGAVGGMKAILSHASRHALERRQFGRAIADFGLVREKLAQMAVDCFAAESAVWMVAHYIDSGSVDYSIEAAITKIFASEAMQRAAYEGLQIAGGSGYMREMPYEQMARDARILTVFEGTNEILRLYVALSSLKDVGASLADVRHAVAAIFNDPIKGFGVLSAYAGRRLTQAVGRADTGFAERLAPPLRPLLAVYQRHALAAARAAELVLRRHGHGITEQQPALKRVADVLIDLFVGLCTVSRADAMIRAGEGGAGPVLEMATIFTRQARRRMMGNVRSMSRNEDPDVDAVAAAVLKDGSYRWDVY
ncbi:MAG: acyl-CoA dehydrogenase family protein [Proteobacteria bacterium]|nr:acyl-CoA dehydrogenase family protein [Pseudomonadota bacterium]